MKRGCVIGLTGGIATGKSTAARFFLEAGARLVDADQLARDVVQPGSPALAEIRGAFGDDVIRSDGTLDRDSLGAKVFADEGARRRLNAIVHPRITEAGRRAVEAIQFSDPGALIVYDVPLLYETGSENRFDAVVVVYVPRQEQRRRLKVRDGVTAEAAEERISSQMDIEEKARRADYVIVNTGTVEELRERVLDLVLRWKEGCGSVKG